MSGAGGIVIALVVLAAAYAVISLWDRLVGSIGDKIEGTLDDTLHRKLPINDDQPKPDDSIEEER